MKTYSRKEVSDLSGVNKETLRYYEDRGLLPSLKRSGNGYRKYNDEHLSVLRLIVRLRSVGFALDEIGTFMDAYRNNDFDSLARMRGEGLESKIIETDRKIAELTRIRQILLAVSRGDSFQGFNNELP